MKKYKDYMLAAIVRSTDTRIAVIGLQKTSYDFVFHIEYNTGRISNLSELLIKTMGVAKENAGIKVTKACIAAAGPVSRNRDHVHLTKSELNIDKDDIIKRTGLKAIYLLNDYEAIAYGIDLINKHTDLIKLPHIDEELVPRQTDECTISVIGSERGLGMAIASYDRHGKAHTSVPSEGGHIELVAVNKDEQALASFLQRKYGSWPGYDVVISKQGIFDLFDFYCMNYPNKKNKLLQRQAGDEKLKSIQENYHTVKACRKTMQSFIKLYGRICKALALMSQCYSGLFVTDMLMLHNIREKDKDQLLKLFMKEFESSRTRSDVLRKVPIYLMTNNKAAMLGCYKFML